MESAETASKRIVESRLRVRYAETDAMGIVYHANYLVWMEIGRTEYLRAVGFTYRELESEYKVNTPVVEVKCRYIASARYDDEIVIRARVNQANKRLIKFGYEIIRAEDERKLAEGESIHLVVDGEGKMISLPDRMVAALRN